MPPLIVASAASPRGSASVFAPSSRSASGSGLAAALRPRRGVMLAAEGLTVPSVVFGRRGDGDGSSARGRYCGESRIGAFTGCRRGVGGGR